MFHTLPVYYGDDWLIISLNNIKCYECRRSTTRFLAPSRSSGIYILPLFFYVSFVHPFANTRQLAERREACLLCLLPRQRVRGGSQHEEKLLLTSGGCAAIHLVSGCQQFIRLPEEAKSQAQSKTSLLMWHVFNEERCV